MSKPRLEFLLMALAACADNLDKWNAENGTSIDAEDVDAIDADLREVFYPDVPEYLASRGLP